MWREQRREITTDIANSDATTADMDQGMDERHSGNLADFDKLPDVVRGLREFSGNVSEISSGRKSV